MLVAVLPVLPLRNWCYQLSENEMSTLRDLAPKLFEEALAKCFALTLLRCTLQWWFQNACFLLGLVRVELRTRRQTVARLENLPGCLWGHVDVSGCGRALNFRTETCPRPRLLRLVILVSADSSML